MSQNCFNSKSFLMSMGRSAGFAPSHYFAMKRWSSSPYINRFLSADTIVPGYANPQNLNRYSYVTNNPLRYTDPTGHWTLETNKPQEEEKRNAYISAYKRTSKNKHSGHLKEYYLVAAAYYQSLADEAPVESTSMLATKLQGQAENVIRNGWNGVATGKTAAGDVALGTVSDVLGNATIGLAGLFAKSGIRTSTEFDKRLEDWGIKDKEALNVYNNGQKYTDDQGRLLRWDPKSKLRNVSMIDTVGEIVKLASQKE